MFSSLTRKVLLLSFPQEMSSCTHTRTHKVKPSQHTEEEVHWISKNSVPSCLINVAFLAHLLTPVCRCLPHPQRALLTGHLSGLWSSEEGTQPLESSSQRKTASSWSQSVGFSAASCIRKQTVISRMLAFSYCCLRSSGPQTWDLNSMQLLIRSLRNHLMFSELLKEEEEGH